MTEENGIFELIFIGTIPILLTFTTKIKIVIFAGIKILPDGVTGNTPDSGSGKSRFDP